MWNISLFLLPLALAFVGGCKTWRRGQDWWIVEGCKAKPCLLPFGVHINMLTSQNLMDFLWMCQFEAYPGIHVLAWGKLFSKRYFSFVAIFLFIFLSTPFLFFFLLPFQCWHLTFKVTDHWCRAFGKQHPFRWKTW